MNASLISRYLFRNLAVSTLIATVIVSLVAWLIESLKFFELAINGGAPVGLFLFLVMLAMPPIVAVVLPIIFFTVILFVYNKLTAESELIVLRALGLSQWRLAMPALALGAIVATIVFILNAFVAPLANERLKTLQDITRTQFAGAPLNAGVFNAIGDKMTIYVREREPNGDLLGILIYQEQSNGRPTTTVAKRGVLVDGDHGPEIVVYNVSRQEVDAVTGRPRTTEFERGTVDLQQVAEALTARWKEPSERTLPELLSGVQGESDKGFGSAFRAEAHNRIGSPFFALALTLVGLYTLLGGHFDRRGQSRRIIAGAVMVLLIEGASISLANFARNNWAAIPLLYLAALGPIVVVLLLFAHANDGFQPWRLWLLRVLPRWAVFWQAA
ncbi:MAG: putative rane spanning protein [Rhodospirillales bacterium]|nr:putative rane spanning protein [Rhodospirillales bacterium]